MIPLAAISLGTQLVGGLAQTIGSASQKKPIIPEYEIPEEVYQNMSDAEYWAFQGMPTAQKEQYIQNVQRTSTAALSGLEDRKAGLGAITNLAQNETDAWKSMLAMDEERRWKNQQALYGARERVAEEKRIKDDIDRQIALDERDRRDQGIGAGLQNVMNALGTIAGADVMSEGGLLGGLNLGNLFGGGRKAARLNAKNAASTAASNAMVKKSLNLDPFSGVKTSSQLAASQPKITL